MNKLSVLGYSFPHRKTQDVILNLKLRGVSFSVFHAPATYKKTHNPLIHHRPDVCHDMDTSSFCDSLGVDHVCLNSVADYNPFVSDYTLIAGCGILPEDLSSTGRFINSHPGILPTSRGLDSFKWSILNKNQVGVTSHIISGETDAGKLIKWSSVPLFSSDTFHSFAYRQYQVEVEMLCSSIDDLPKSSLEELRTDVSVPKKRMSSRHEFMLFKAFEDYKLSFLKTNHNA